MRLEARTAVPLWLTLAAPAGAVLTAFVLCAGLIA